MWDEDPLQTEVRRTRRRERLGENPQCILCGCGQAEALTVPRGKVRRYVLEEHHPAGWKNDPELKVILCLNCHRVATEKCRRAGVSLDWPPTLLHRIVALLRGVAALLADLGDSCYAAATKLERLIERLDEVYPAWREMEDE